MRFMSKRQNAGEYNNGLPLMSSNPGCSRKGFLVYDSFTLLSRSQPHAHFQSADFRSILPDNYQGSCQKTLTARQDISAS
jgi:hypothetical protein